MIRKTHLAALLVVAIAAVTPVRADPPLSPETVKQYANQLGAAFPGQVDIHFVGGDYEAGRAPLPNVRIIGCSQVAGVLYYVVRLNNGSETFIPQSQILAIHNQK